MKEQIEMFEIALMCPHQPLAVTNEKVDFFLEMFSDFTAKMTIKSYAHPISSS